MNSEKQNLRPVFADQVNTMVNLLKPYMPSTETYENSDGGAVHPTRNSDGSISLSGETLDAGITIKAGTAYLRTDKSYCLCGTPGQGVNLQIIIDGKTYTDNGTGATFSVTSGGYFDVNVVINPHTQIDKLTIYPIVTRNMQAKFGDFVPYISDTDQLNAQVADLSARLTQVQLVDTYIKNWNGKIFYFYKYGHIVIMMSPQDLQKGQTLSAGETKIFTVPEEFKPPITAYGYVSNRNDDTRGFVDSKGNLTLYAPTNIVGAANLALTCVYYVE